VKTPRRLVGLVLAAAAALVLAGCASLSPYAAKVNGERISQGDLDRELKAIGGNRTYLADLEQGLAQEGARVRGDGNGTYDTGFVARVLNRRIALEVIHQEVQRRRLRVGPAELRRARAGVALSFGNDAQASRKIFGSFPAAYQKELVRTSAEVVALQGVLGDVDTSPAAVRAFYDANPSLFTQTCVRHILVDTAEKAAELKARIAAGEDFGAIARTDSKDNQGPGGGSAGQGGALGCITQQQTQQLVPEFAAAMNVLPPGVVSDPVQTQFGFHLIQITERRTQTLEEATPEITQRLQEQGNGAIGTFVGSALGRAKVVVNPRYGRFDRSSGNPRVRAPQELSPTPPSPTASVPPEQ
jgi:hypothetical protein